MCNVYECHLCVLCWITIIGSRPNLRVYTKTAHEPKRNLLQLTRKLAPMVRRGQFKTQKKVKILWAALDIRMGRFGLGLRAVLVRGPIWSFPVIYNRMTMCATRFNGDCDRIKQLASCNWLLYDYNNYCQ